MNEEKDTDGTTDAHEGDHTPADGAGTEGEGGKPDTRPGDRLATIRRTLVFRQVGVSCLVMYFFRV